MIVGFEFLCLETVCESFENFLLLLVDNPRFGFQENFTLAIRLARSGYELHAAVLAV